MKKGSKEPPQSQPKNKNPPKSNIDFQKWVKPGMSLDDVMKLKDCFDIFDYDHGGSVSPQ